jgi:8-oxo-dGTP pyrophosphatase MutT (NUDIX family)
MAKKKERGGVIPYYIVDGEIKMMFMQPSNNKYGGSKFQVAKGKIEDGETPIEGAFREAKEELGLFGPNVIQSDSLGRFGKIHVFIAKIKDPDMFGDTTDETGAVTWWTAEQFQAEGRDWQKPIVKAAVRKINKLENLDEKPRTLDRHSRASL